MSVNIRRVYYFIVIFASWTVLGKVELCNQVMYKRAPKKKGGANLNSIYFKTKLSFNLSNYDMYVIHAGRAGSIILALVTMIYMSKKVVRVPPPCLELKAHIQIVNKQGAGYSVESMRTCFTKSLSACHPPPPSLWLLYTYLLLFLPNLKTLRSDLRKEEGCTYLLAYTYILSPYLFMLSKKKKLFSPYISRISLTV